MPVKQYKESNVYEETIKRIEYVFDNFERIYISFSGGKDSTVMLHMVMDEAIKRNKKVGVNRGGRSARLWRYLQCARL